MIEVNISRAPRGELAARALIDAIVVNDDRVERHYLEVKSGLDLTTKKDQAKIAKFILGAANRMPDQAARAFEGYGVMVIGASQALAAGIAPIEALEVQKAVLPFIGADGPRYDLVRVPSDDSRNEILVVLVDPPELGQGPFICHRSGDGGLRDGAVFVRADGETREARGDELRQLIQRGQVAAAQIDFNVRIVGVARPIEIDDQRTLEEYLSVHRSRLRTALEHAKNPPDPATSSDSQTRNLGPSLAAIAKAQAADSAISEPESRSEEDYLASIDAWEQRVRDAWPEAILSLIGGLADPLAIEVTNREKTFLHDVKLGVHLAGQVFGVDAWEPGVDISADVLEIPVPPRAWGPTASKFGDLGLNLGEYSRNLASSIHLPSVPMPTRTSWTNSGSIDLEFFVGELRPKEVDACDDGELVLYTLDRTITSVQGTWEITARDHHDVFSGSLDVEVGDPLDLTHAFRQILGLEATGW